LPKILVELFEMKVPLDPIDYIDDGADILIEYLSLLQTFKSDKALVGRPVAGSLKSWNLFLRDRTVTGQFVNCKDAATATSPRSLLRHECTHKSLVLSCLLVFLSRAWHCCLHFLFLSKYNFWRQIVLFLNCWRLRFW
jgi:hypothetical protein